MRKAASTLAFENRSLNMHIDSYVSSQKQPRGAVPSGGDHVDEDHQRQEKWNGAGTFGFLVTLKKHERYEKAAEWQSDCAD